MKCRLRAILESRGISQTQLSLDTGLSNTTVSKLAGNRFEVISKSTIETVAKYLELTEFSELFDLERDPNEETSQA